VGKVNSASEFNEYSFEKLRDFEDYIIFEIVEPRYPEEPIFPWLR
jgi:hypothetical protein